ncbi:hypothetical protein RCS94_02515 [Orbaceae bacterium ac157xtp]
MIVPSSYGALSATSANTIQGSRPGFTAQSGAKRLGFKIANTTYSESEGNLSPSSSGVINYLNAGLRLDEFDVTNLTASDFSLTTDYYDSDGDTGYPTAADTFSMGSVTYDWYENGKDPDNDAPISVTDQTLGCGSSLSLPLTLRITLPDVKVRSRYGNPDESIPTDLVQEYKIGTASGICFAKPNQMIVYPGYTWLALNGSTFAWNSGSSTPTASGGGGYSADFDPVNGFKANANPKFPTTGFPKASFTLIMTSNASDYTFRVLKPDGSLLTDGSVTVGTDGKVTLNSKPTEPVTIEATFNGQVHTYTFDPRTVWVVPNPTKMSYASAVSACGGTDRIPTRAHLTNSPQINHPGGISIPDNRYTRAVGGGVLGEWGTTSSTYPGSQWVAKHLWTRDPYSATGQFVIAASGGYVHWYNISKAYNVACLE